MKNHRFLGFAFVVVLLVVHWGVGCAASGGVGFSDDDVGAGLAGVGGGTGGQGDGQGGGPDGEMWPCGTDCTLIQTDACHEGACDEQTLKCTILPAENGAPCDDGMFCTIEDACQGGTCGGGSENTCGLQVSACQQITCIEASQSCESTAAADGQLCTPDDLCQVNGQCTSGLCIGQPKDCFLAPTPSECHVAECNPQTGDCDAVPGNGGQACTDANDKCTVGKTCDNVGNCVGGAPLDCSSLTVGCLNGVCDPLAGTCQQIPVVPGDQCAEGSGECTVGICDNNGNCVPTAAYEGQICNDFNACNENETCQSGVCSGGQAVTDCGPVDGCCPAGCGPGGGGGSGGSGGSGGGGAGGGPNFDQDCLCGLDKLYFTELNVGSKDFIKLHNPTQCALDLDPLVIFFDDSSASDLTTNLPSFMLQPGDSVYIIESGSSPDISAGSNIFFDPSRGGAAILCDGACNATDGSNVIDVIAFQGGALPPALPTGISFTPTTGVTGITSTNQSTQSWLRMANMGATPGFFGSDWQVGTATK